MKKFINNNEVAVIFHNDYGRGWSDRYDGTDHLFNYDIVQWILNGKKQGVEKVLIVQIFGDGSYYFEETIQDLEIAWVPVGTKFRVHEYDGKERVILENEETWFIA